MYKVFKSSLKSMELFMKSFVKEGYKVIDATLGNGYDSLKLCELVGSSGKVYSFDIQKEAIENSKKKLQDYRNIKLILDSHENLSKYIEEKIDFIIYNLGYLPGGDKTITTKASTTIESLKVAFKLLADNGVIGIVVYPGHKTGNEELKEIDIFLRGIDQRQFSVVKFDYINQINNPPVLYFIEKNKER